MMKTEKKVDKEQIRSKEGKMLYLHLEGVIHIKKSTLLQISSSNERTGGKSGIKWKMKLTQSNSFR